MTHLPRPTLRALRSVVARALGVRRSRVRIVERVYPHAPPDALVRCAVVRVRGGLPAAVAYVGKGSGPRDAVRFLARRFRRSRTR